MVGSLCVENLFGLLMLLFDYIVFVGINLLIGEMMEVWFVLMIDVYDC